MSGGGPMDLYDIPGRDTSIAPDPQICYRNVPRDGAADGIVLPVGTTGVFGLPVPAPADDNAVGARLFRFLRLSEAGEQLAAFLNTRALHQIALCAGEPVYAISVRDAGGEPTPGREAGTQDAGLPGEQVGYRELYGVIGDDELSLVSRAIQIVDWDETTRFCPRCGSPTVVSEHDSSKNCPVCEYAQYPRLAPAMIVGVVRDRKLLLGQSPRFRGAFHSILAGFVEAGETAEGCVRREVYEEVGVTVRNIRYFGSQPWPFPHSLMLGFTAEYEAGEIAPNPQEIVHADWYAADALPNVPGEVSISGRIINWFRRTYG